MTRAESSEKFRKYVEDMQKYFKKELECTDKCFLHSTSCGCYIRETPDEWDIDIQSDDETTKKFCKYLKEIQKYCYRYEECSDKCVFHQSFYGCILTRFPCEWSIYEIC